MRKLIALVLTFLCGAVLAACGIAAGAADAVSALPEEPSAGPADGAMMSRPGQTDDAGILLAQEDGIRVYYIGYEDAPSDAAIRVQIENASASSCVVGIQGSGIQVDGAPRLAALAAAVAPGDAKTAAIELAPGTGTEALAEQNEVETVFCIATETGTACTGAVRFCLDGTVLADGSGTDEAPQPGAAPLRIGIINRSPDESVYRAANVEDFERVFTPENGYDPQTFYSDDNDEQLAAAQQFITDGVDYLLICPSSVGDGWAEVLQEAADAGIRVILYGGSLENAYLFDEHLFAGAVGSDMQEGKKAMEWLSANVDAPAVVHIQGTLGSEDQVARSWGLQKMQPWMAGIEIAAQQPADWSEEEAKAFVESVIRSGQPFNAIYSESDEMTRGAVEALDEAGITHGVGGDVMILSIGGSKWALRELQEGRWNYEGLCGPRQADAAAELIEQMECGVELHGELVAMPDPGLTAQGITEAGVQHYGIGE